MTREFWLDPSLTLIDLCKESIDALRPSFLFLIDLEKMKKSGDNGEEAEFYQLLATEFQLGPFGLGPVVEYLFQLHNSVISSFERRNMHADDVRNCLFKINIIAEPLEALLGEFRSSTFRGSYDPKGISDLHDVIKKGRNNFDVRPSWP